MADEFQGGTSAGGVTGSELAEVCQQSYVRVMGHNIHRQGETMLEDAEECNDDWNPGLVSIP